MKTDIRIYHGDIVFAPSAKKLEENEDSYIVVEDGTVSGIYEHIPDDMKALPVTDFGRNLITPAFSDLHVHGAQFVQRGIAMDCLLKDWLNDYTFPQEAKFKDPEYGKLCYDAFVEDMLRHGTFHANVFTTVHRETSEYLFHTMEKKGMYGFVGKVNMDCHCPDYLKEDTDRSLRETEEFLAGHTRPGKVRPILVPRFAPVCSEKLLKGLGALARKYQCGIHTHLVESRWEAATALECFPGYESDAQIYEKTGLLGHGPSIFAHVIFPTGQDTEILKHYESFAVHCPEATNNVIAGIMPLKRLEIEDVKVAIGTDVGAAGSLAVYRQIAKAVQLSKLKEFYEPGEGKTITLAQAFYHATKQGGELFGKVGSFEKGYRFNALVIENMEDPWSPLSAAKRLERFCYAGDDRNIMERFIDGVMLPKLA
ncbi:MAG: amidohydrolase family protein [Lachnospiraceae bacterium]|nr:amidohydrolase family protein [Lachnospiraceae bacterium]